MKNFILLTSLVLLSVESIRAQYDPAPVSFLGNISTYSPTAIVPVSVTDFIDIGSCDLTLEYDYLIATPTSVTIGTDIPGSLNWSISNPGVLEWSWYVNEGMGVTLDDNTVIFNITFIKMANGTSLLSWDNEGSGGTLCRWFNADQEYLIDDPTDEYYVDGSLSFLSPNAPDTYADTGYICNIGATVNVPVTVTNFTNIGSISLKMTYNISTLNYVGCIYPTPKFPGLTVNVPPPGGVIYSGGYSSTGGITYSGETLLYTLIFTYQGGSSDLNWVSTYDTDCDYTDYPSFSPLNDDPFADFYHNGRIESEVPEVGITGDSSICINGTTTLAPVTGGTWSSNNPTIASVTNSGLVTGLSVGIATFTFTETDTGCSNTTSEVIVNLNPSAPVSGGDVAVCSGQAIPVLTVTVGAEETADWYTAASGGSPLATGALTYTPSAAGIFYAEARNLTTGCMSSDRTGITLTIHPLPAVFAGTDQDIPYGTSTTISDATASGTATLSYSWTPAAVFVDPTVLNPATVNLTSTNTCTLAVTDGHGCVNTDQLTITVTGGALAANPTAFPDTVCFGEPTQLTANASGGSGTYTYSWTSDPAGFTSSQASAQDTPDVNTTYTVVVDDGFNTVSGSVTVVVINLEVTCPENMEVFLSDPAFQLTGGLPTGGIYSGTGVMDGWFDPAIAGVGEHTLTYNYEDANGCTDFCTFLITVSGNVIDGDANCDGFVNVLDIITIVNYIMELNPVPFCFPEADVNNDLIINVMDIIGTVNIIMAP